jgi:mannan endo-1,6-alpha-mannosidase
MPTLQISAIAASRSCSGGFDGVTCGTKLYTGGWDGTWGVGQQLSALDIVQLVLVAKWQSIHSHTQSQM